MSSIDGRDCDSGARARYRVPAQTDVDVLLAELERVQAEAHTASTAPSAAEAVTLASAAMRLVENQLGETTGSGLTTEDLTLSRTVLSAALKVLLAALDGAVEADPETRRDRRRRRRVGHAPRLK
ncbi:MAG: hypothetical protein ABI232_03645 [Jatrophihabitantaceae bacterium]